MQESCASEKVMVQNLSVTTNVSIQSPLYAPRRLWQVCREQRHHHSGQTFFQWQGRAMHTRSLHNSYVLMEWVSQHKLLCCGNKQCWWFSGFTQRKVIPHFLCVSIRLMEISWYLLSSLQRQKRMWHILTWDITSILISLAISNPNWQNALILVCTQKMELQTVLTSTTITDWKF